MLELYKQEIDTPCPSCSFYNTITLKQIRLRDVTICRGCKSNIKLDDYSNEIRKALRTFRRVMNDLESTLNNFKLNI